MLDNRKSKWKDNHNEQRPNKHETNHNGKRHTHKRTHSFPISPPNWKLFSLRQTVTTLIWTLTSLW
jgi:hypothetical protein